MTNNYSLLFYTINLLQHHIERVPNVPRKKTEIHFTTQRPFVLSTFDGEAASPRYVKAFVCWSGSSPRPQLRSEYTQKMNSSIQTIGWETNCHPHISIFWHISAAILHRCAADRSSMRKQIYPWTSFPSFLCILTPLHVCVLQGILVNLCMCHVSLCMPV